MRNRRLLISLITGAAALAAAAPASAVVPTTARVSLDSSGAQINSYNALPVVSANGRWVAFDSYSDKVVSGDANGQRDVFLRDRQTGETRRISARPGGLDANGPSAGPSISADGRYIAFISDATNLSTGTQNASDDVYLYDRDADKLTRVSTSLTGNDGGGASTDPMVANDGKALVFASTANDLVAGDSGKQDVFSYDIASAKLTRVSVIAAGATSNGDSYGADVSDDARFVSFTSQATNLVTGDANGFADIFVRDMQTGTTTRESVTSAGGEGNNTSSRSSISGDGCSIAFDSYATNLAANDDLVARNKVMFRDRCKKTTEIASLSNANAIANTRDARRPFVSDNGCIVTFVSSSLVPGAAQWGAFARDRCKGITQRLDVSNGSDAGNGGVDYLTLSPGKGRYAAFDSSSSNLVAGDTNATFDAFVRDMGDAAAPTADLKLSVDGMRVRADASGSRDADGNIASARVSFGDGTTEENGLTTSHTYKRAGSYTVTLIVTDDDGLTSTTSQPVTVVDSTGGVDPGPVSTPTPQLPQPQKPVAKPQLKLKAGSLLNDRKGLRLVLTSSEAAKTKVQILRQVKTRGKKKPGWTKVTAVSKSLKAGSNTVVLAKPGALKPGSYRVTASAKTKDGRATTKSLTRTFTIAKEKS